MRSALRADLAGRIVLGVAVLVVVFLGGQALVGATEIGVGVDDYIHALRADAWLNTGWYVPEYQFAGGEPDPDQGGIPWVYGAALAAIAHLANVAVGNETIGEISLDGDAYAVKHVVVALIGLGAMLCVGGAVRTLTRDRLAAVWSCAALLAIPVWTGYTMFSIKDVPVAAGFTFVTFGLVLGLARAGEAAWPPSRRMLGPGALVAAGVLLGVGTRPAMWVPLLVSLAVFGGLAWTVTRSRRDAARSLAAPGFGFALGLGGVAALHPRNTPDPVEWLINSVSESSEAGREGVYTLTAGELLSEFPPAWYLPTWTFASVPVLVFVIAAVGAVVVIRQALRSRPGHPAGQGPSMAVTGGMLLVVLQLFLLPAAASVAGSATYTGLRQHLYVLPAIAILAGIGAARLMRAKPASEGSFRRVGWIPALVLCLALVVPAVEQTRLYPYNYVYVNEVAGIGGVEGRWETEYQFISVREAFHRVPAAVEPHCSPDLVPAEGSPDRPIIEACYASLPSYADEVGSESTARPRPGEVWVVGRTRSGNRPPGYCREYDNVTRPLRGENIVMAYVLRCTPPSRTQRPARARTDASASTTDGSSSVPARARSSASASGAPVARARASSQAPRTTLEASGIPSPASSRDSPPS